MRSMTIRWRCGCEQKHPGFRAFAGNADKDTEGATRHNKSKDAHGEMPLGLIDAEAYWNNVEKLQATVGMLKAILYAKQKND